jgi:ribulose-phosphate 3-epimerase
VQNNRTVIIPSIASGNPLDVQSEISFIDRNYGHIHIDIEDGNYVPNITFGEKLLRLICEKSASQKSIHLMVNKPEMFLKAIKECKPEIVFLHTDVTRFPSELINLFMNEGLRVGIALNPGVAIGEIEYALPLVNDVMIMTCEPDGRGQIYIKAMEDRIRTLSSFGINLWADGGIMEDRISSLTEIGVRNIVMGRAVFADRNRIIRAE